MFSRNWEVDFLFSSFIATLPASILSVQIWQSNCKTKCEPSNLLLLVAPFDALSVLDPLEMTSGWGSSIATECLLDVEGKVCDEGSYERPLAHPRALSRGARFRPRESEQWRFCCSLGSCEVVGQAAELQINDPGSNPAINLLQDKARNLIGL